MIYKVGERVLFYDDEMQTGTITRVGQTTVSIKEDVEGWNFMHKRVRFSQVYPATEENLKRLEEIRSILKKLSDFDAPLRADLDRLRMEIRASKL